MGSPFARTGQVVGSPALHKPVISMTCSTYNAVGIEEIAHPQIDGGTVLQFEPQDLHIEIGQGMTNTNVASSGRPGFVLHDGQSPVAVPA